MIRGVRLCVVMIAALEYMDIDATRGREVVHVLYTLIDADLPQLGPRLDLRLLLSVDLEVIWNMCTICALALSCTVTEILCIVVNRDDLMLARFHTTIIINDGFV